MGTGVLVLPGRNPMLVAAQLAALAALAPRRVLPVFGVRPALTGERDLFPVPDGQRAAVFDEAVLVVRRLLTEKVVTHHGRFFHLDEASVAPHPARRLDLWLAGRAPAALARIGRLADGWLGSFVTPEESGRCRAAIGKAAAQAGREIEDDHSGWRRRRSPKGLRRRRLWSRHQHRDPATRHRRQQPECRVGAGGDPPSGCRCALARCRRMGGRT